jgi:hypothetical protein
LNDQNPENGIPLRADVHTLFDLLLIGIEPKTLTVDVHPRLRGTEYEAFHGRQILTKGALPSKAALERRWNDYLSNKA